MPEWLIVVLLGIIEGITEFIPVSSTGHLLLAEHLLGDQASWLNDKDSLFTIVIQSAAVLAVIPLFRERLSRLSRLGDPASRDYFAKVMVAFVITAIGGFALDKLGFTLPDKPMPIALALLIGGILFVIVERWLKGSATTAEITWTVALVVAGGQLLAAVFPGASRSGSTILLSLMLGVTRPAATEFSFLVGIPTMLAAGGWKILKVFLGSANPPDWGMVLLGAVVSAVVSFIAVKWLLRFVQSHTFIPFGIYRIVFGVLLLVFLHR